MNNTGFFFDFEVLKNCFTATFIPVDTNRKHIDEYIKADIEGDVSKKKEVLAKIKVKTFITFNGINQLLPMISFIKSSRCKTLISYNGRKYDDIILDYIITKLNTNKSIDIITAELYTLSQDILASQRWSNYRKDNDISYSGYYYSIDLMKLHYLSISLTQVSIALKWYRVEEYDPPAITDAEMMEFGYLSDNIAWYDRYVLDTHLVLLLEYNLNDVLVLYELYYVKIDELKNRIATSTRYNVNVTSDSRSTTSDKVMSKLYGDATGLKWWDFNSKRTYRRTIKFDDLIYNTIEFKSKQLQSFLNYIKSITIKVESSDKFKESLIYKGVKYTFGKGGLHSKDRGGVFKSTDKYKIVDYDFDSFYLQILTLFRIKPRHILEIFVDIVKMLTDTRIKAKKEGDKETASINKTILVAIFGKYGLDSWTFDLKALYGVTVNGQLLLLMLAERLELLDIHILSANTDGLVAKVPVDKYDLYKQTCNEFSDEIGISGEFTEYSRYIRTNVNNYITLKSNGKAKTKGEFVSSIEIDKGYKHPVVAKVVQEFYINDNINIDETLRQYDILDYCISIKVGGQFKTELHTLKDGKLDIEILQKSNRYYISNKGGVILKRNLDDNSLTNIVKGKYVTVINRLVIKDDYDINYTWYKSKVMNVINRINNALTKDIKVSSVKSNKSKISGTMFDELN